MFNHNFCERRFILNKTRLLVSALALVCASVTAHATTVNFSYDANVGSSYEFHVADGQFAGVDGNNDGKLSLGELSAFTSQTFYGSPVGFSGLTNFGTYDIAANRWNADSYLDMLGNNVYMSGMDSNGQRDFLIEAGNTRMTTTQVSAPVPEPETYTMMVAGLGALGWIGRRRKAKRA